MELERWRVGLDLGVHTVAFGAYNSDWKSMPLSGEIPQISEATSLGLVAGFRVLPALELGLDMDYYLVQVEYRISSLSGSFTQSTTERYNALWIGPRLGWDFLLRRRFHMGLQAGLGYLGLLNAGEDSTYSSFSSSSSDTASFSGSTVGFKGGLEAYWRISHRFGLSFDLGYRVATIGQATYSGSSTSSTGAKTNFSGTLHRFGPGSSGGNMPLDYSGLDFKVGTDLSF
jgi:hypothetical protein